VGGPYVLAGQQGLYPPQKPRSKAPVIVAACLVVLLVAGVVAFALRARPDADADAGLNQSGDAPGTSVAVPAADVPAGLGSCPAQMTPVGWTQYPEGHMLVCGTLDTFDVQLAHGGKDLTATDLTFVKDGWTVTSKDGTVVTVRLGGGMVTVGSTSWAAQGWSRATGLIVFSGAEVSGCPSADTPLSLATWADGWVLVCGADQHRPTWAAWYDPGVGSGTSSNVRTTTGQYCASSGSLDVCTTASPAIVLFSGGPDVQRAPQANWFVGYGPGGAGSGTGFSDVPTPDDTDADQVRYLVDLLVQSASARASLGPAVTAVIECNNVSAQIPIISSVADNRRELLTALDTTPVDKIPNGQTLLTQLRDALNAALGADEAYLAWAREMVATGCAVSTSSSHWADGQFYDELAGTTKTTFVNNWNATIAPRYNAPTFTRDQI